MDQRNIQLAENLVNYSCKIKTGEKVMISFTGMGPTPLIKQIVKQVYKVGGIPFVEMKTLGVEREVLLGGSEEQFDLMAKWECEKMRSMDAYIGVGGDENLTELSDVPSEKITMHSVHYMRPVNDIRVPHTKWVVLRYPTANMAQSAKMSLEGFSEFYYKVCNLDYEKMSQAMDNLVNLMNKTDKVRIVGEGTDISFSIKDIPAIKCAGECNVPDGEVYTAPVKNSVNGVISYNTPSEYNSFTFENVKLTFRDGKIVDCSANDTTRLNEIFDTDEGARYIGEFAIGVNPYIEKPMNNILFDEKIMGSIHFTPGNCYEEAENGNKSAIHWDLVYIQRPEYGGGEIYFDDILIRKDGRFVLEELFSLNPEQLM